MRKTTVLCLIAGTLFSLSACKSSQNAYKEAYEKAVSNDEPKAVIEEPVTQNEAPTAEDVTNISVREEKVSVVSGDQEIKAYGIVCGSFSLRANADALRDRLVKDGYQAVVVVNEAGKTFRVVCASLIPRRRPLPSVPNSRQDILTIRISKAPGFFTGNNFGKDSCYRLRYQTYRYRGN